MVNEKLNKYVCKHPFNYLDVQPYHAYICCPSWCPKSIRDDGSHEISWDSENAVEIRKSVLDGSYKYCDHQVCPSLNTLINTPEVPSVFVEKDKFYEQHNIKSIEDVEKIISGPEYILFGFDYSCNFRCPSCRKNLIPNDEEDSFEYQNKLKTLKKIEDKFSNTIKEIMITGSGDPFYSKIYRDYLINFDESKYPNLEQIKIITNGRLLTKKMWESLKAKKYIKHIEISIDAGCKETYENKTRLGGDWQILLDNLNFISTLDTVKNFTASFVVSELNYKEMYTFYKIINDIFIKSKIDYNIFFSQHVFWPNAAYTQSEVENISVFDINHPLFDDFLNELQKIHGVKEIHHNFHHLISHFNKMI